MKRIAAVAGLLALLGCASSSPEVFPVVSSLDQLRAKGNLVQLRVAPITRESDSPKILGWYYQAVYPEMRRAGYGFDLGYGSSVGLYNNLAEIVDETRTVLGEGNFNGIVLHTYSLNDEQRDQIVKGIDSPNIAFVTERPPAPKPEVKLSPNVSYERENRMMEMFL